LKPSVPSHPPCLSLCKTPYKTPSQILNTRTETQISLSISLTQKRRKEREREGEKEKEKEFFGEQWLSQTQQPSRQSHCTATPRLCHTTNPLSLSSPPPPPKRTAASLSLASRPSTQPSHPPSRPLRRRLPNGRWRAGSPSRHCSSRSTRTSRSWRRC
jgi:hypothetical protein